MTTNQEGKHASFRAISSTTGTYMEDAAAAFIVEGATGSSFDELFVSWLQARTSSVSQNLPGLQHLFATQLGFDNWNSVNTFGTSGNRDDPLGAIVASCVFDCDATITGSYPGSGQTWGNLETTPADSELQAVYDFFLGDDVGAEANDPEFVGSAGTASAHFLFDGNDRFTLQTAGNTDFINGWGKTDENETAFTWVFAMRTPEAGSANAMYTGDLIATRQGLFFGVNSAAATPNLNLGQHGESSSANWMNAEPAALTTSQDVFIGLGWDGSSVATIWFNSATGATPTVLAKATCTADAFYDALAWGFSTADTTRVYAISTYNELLSDASMALIAAHYELRHGRSYV